MLRRLAYHCPLLVRSVDEGLACSQSNIKHLEGPAMKNSSEFVPLNKTNFLPKPSEQKHPASLSRRVETQKMNRLRRFSSCSDVKLSFKYQCRCGSVHVVLPRGLEESMLRPEGRLKTQSCFILWMERKRRDDERFFFFLY